MESPQQRAGYGSVGVGIAAAVDDIDQAGLEGLRVKQFPERQSERDADKPRTIGTVQEQFGAVQSRIVGGRCCDVRIDGVGSTREICDLWPCLPDGIVGGFRAIT